MNIIEKKPQIVRSVSQLREHVAAARKLGKRISLVPTMGGLHDGHLALVKKAMEIADFVIVSLFVNPTQFNNPDDLDTYPGNEEEDKKLLSETATDLLFAPTAQEMYPEGFSAHVQIEAGRNILCDAHRPGHFDGVATVVAKLLNQAGADFACFGEKDFQQLFIVRQLTRDLDIPTQIVPVETVREASGLALSSRNARLTKEEHEEAPHLNREMQEAAAEIRKGTPVKKACDAAIKSLRDRKTFQIEYFEYRSGNTLAALSEFEKNGRIFAAAWLGNVRLIDNIPV